MKNKLTGDLKIMFIFGLVGLISGLSILTMVGLSLYPGDWSIYYVPFNIIGAILGYLWGTYWKGAFLTWKFGRITPKGDEREMRTYNLIAKYSNKYMITAVPFIAVLYFVLFGINKYQVRNSDIGSFLGATVIVFACVVVMTGGMKFLSAWWGIRKNFDKEVNEYEK